MVTKNLVFEYKVCYNLTCIGDKCPILVPNWGGWGSANLVVLFKPAPDQCLQILITKCLHFHTKVWRLLYKRGQLSGWALQCILLVLFQAYSSFIYCDLSCLYIVLHTLFSGCLFYSDETVIKDAVVTQQAVGTSESETPVPDAETGIVDEDTTQLQCNCLFLLQLNIAIMCHPPPLVIFL